MSILTGLQGKAIGFISDVGSQIGDVGSQLLGGKKGGGSAAPGNTGGFNVQDMVSSINRSGIAQSSHFEVYIHWARQTGASDLVSRADSVNLPGRSIMTAEHKFTNYGPINKVPYGQIYGDSTVTFLLSEDLREKDFFEHWQEAMINTGAYEENLESVRPESKWNVKYFDGYLGTVTIRQYGAAGNLKTIHKLQEAYPILMGDVAMGWGNSDAAKLSITFAYKNYTYVTEDNSNQPGLGTGFSFNIGKGGLSGALKMPGFANISHDNNIGTMIGGLNSGSTYPDASASLAAAQASNDKRKEDLAWLKKFNARYKGSELRLPASGNATKGNGHTRVNQFDNKANPNIKF